MGGLFSFGPKNQETSLFEKALLQVDPDAALDTRATGAAATTSHHPGAASLAESSMSTRDDSVGTFASVTDRASDSGSEAVGPAEGTQGS